MCGLTGRSGKSTHAIPPEDERDAADCFVCISSTFEKVVMIETEAKEAPENIVYECIRVAHEANMEIVKFINSIVAEIGKPKFTFEKAAVNHELLDDLMAYGLNQIEYALDTPDKNVREERLTAARLDFQEKFGEKYEDFDTHIEVCLYKMQKKVVKKWLLQGKRVDGRGMDEIRPLAAEVGVLPRVHGSGLFTRGQTQVLSICTLNTLSAAQKLDTIYPEDTKRYIHHYNFPAYSTGEARAARSTSRREIGHGALAEKALLPVIPSVEEFPYAIRVVSEVLSSNGSTSQGSICGSTLALMDAGVPISAPVAGVAMGLIKEGDDFIILTDILGDEDAMGDMDFKVAGTAEGVTGIQMDIKVEGLSTDIMRAAMRQAHEGRLHILGEMTKVIDRPRAQLSPYAPQHEEIYVNPEIIRLIIGPGGKNIKAITTATGAAVDIDDSGKISVFAPTAESLAKTVEMLRYYDQRPELGKNYKGKVRKILEIGCIVEILPNVEALVHISQLDINRVNQVSDVAQLGDEMVVKVIEITGDRIRASRKAVLLEEQGHPWNPEETARPKHDSSRGPRSDRGDRGDRGERRGDRRGRGDRERGDRDRH